jgi:hypothetical protein
MHHKQVDFQINHLLQNHQTFNSTILEDAGDGKKPGKKHEDYFFPANF